jgi:hypothetical protein
MRDERLDECTRHVRKAAEEISAKLGGSKEDHAWTSADVTC